MAVPTNCEDPHMVQQPPIVSEAHISTTCWMEPDAIPAHWDHRPSHPSLGTQERVTTRRVIRRDEGMVQALTLPTITVYNMRSIWAKIQNLGDDINMRGSNLCF